MKHRSTPARQGLRADSVDQWVEVDPFELELELSDRAAPAARRVRVLWIEDDPSLVGAANEYFASSPFDVHFARDGRKGYELIRRGDFDALVLDLGLPGMGGRKLLHHARMAGELPNVPVVVLTGSDPDYAQSARGMGADEILFKPVRLSALAAKLMDLCSYHEAGTWA